MSCKSHPLTHTRAIDNIDSGVFKVSSEQDEVAFVAQMFCRRLNDNKQSVTQYLGSAVVDVSTITSKKYSLEIRDSSTQPPLRTGNISIQYTKPDCQLQHMAIQNEQFSRQMFTAAEANLTWIEGFSPHGYPSIVNGLRYVHSPYYVNHMGVTLPSGAFCMIPTVLDDNITAAVKSLKQRFMISLSRNCMSETHWSESCLEMLDSRLKSKHMRCLSVVADVVTLHARLNILYTPDVQLQPVPKGTERWEVPREPTATETLSFSGDCEDFAREVYQQCKEIREWVQPNRTTTMGLLSSVLHMYIPTIEQGAVDSSAHSKYITYDAPYRNHIWAALHPRNSWKTKIQGKMDLDFLYAQYPEQHCEKSLPLLHLEGTGDVYPIVTHRNPGYIARLKLKKEDVIRHHPTLSDAQTPDMSLQCNHSSSFYKYAVAFMTDIFKKQGVLDYTYITQKKYGVSIYNWARGQYAFRPSTRHSPATMSSIKNMISAERPIVPLLYESKIIKGNKAKFDQLALRFGSNQPIDMENVAQYKIGTCDWYETYFNVENYHSSSSELE